MSRIKGKNQIKFCQVWWNTLNHKQVTGTADKAYSKVKAQILKTLGPEHTDVSAVVFK